MGNAARKARKRAGTRFEKAPKVPTRAYRAKPEQRSFTYIGDLAAVAASTYASAMRGRW